MGEGELPSANRSHDYQFPIIALTLLFPHAPLSRFNLIDIKVNRAYFIWVTAPKGYLFSGQVCNDEIPGKECNYDSDVDKFKYRRWLRGSRALCSAPFWCGHEKENAKGHIPSPNIEIPPSDRELQLGIEEGRSEKCVSIDRNGMPESNLDVGVMRTGDHWFSDTTVEMTLDLIEPDIVVRGRGLRSFFQGVKERALQSNKVKRLDDGTYSYVLLQKDKEAIGIIASEGKREALH